MGDNAASGNVDWLDVDEANAGCDGTLISRMGIVVTELSRDRVVATMPVDGNTQPYGLLHGGASCVLAETLGSIMAAIFAGPGRAAVGLDLNASYHRATRTGVITGVATPHFVGRGIATIGIAISDDQGRPVATCRLTAQLRDAPPGAPSATPETSRIGAAGEA